MLQAKTEDREGIRRTRAVLSCAGHVAAAARRWRNCKSGSSRVHPVSLQRTSKSSPHGQKESAEERGKAASARPRFRSLFDSSPAAPTSPVIPQNKLQSKQGARDPAVAATLSSVRSIFPSSPPSPPPPPPPSALLLSRRVYTSCPELDLQGRCLSKAQESWQGPRQEGKRRVSQKPSDCGFI